MIFVSVAIAIRLWSVQPPSSDSSICQQDLGTGGMFPFQRMIRWKCRVCLLVRDLGCTEDENMDKTKLNKHLAGEIVAHLLAGEIVAHLLEELIVHKLQLLQTL